MDSDKNIEFLTLLRKRTQEKVEEYYQLLHERERIGVRLERAKLYIEQLNDMLKSEGETPITIREPSQGSGFGKIGNRSPKFPVRKPEWLGMSIEDIVKAILGASPNEIYHANVIAHKIYEIKNDTELRMVKQSLVSTLRKGAKKKGLWESIGKNRYKAKAANQPRLVKI